MAIDRPIGYGRYFRARGAPRGDSRRSMTIAAVVMVCGLTVVLQVLWTARNRHLYSPFAVERITCDLCRGLGVIAVTGDDGLRRLEMCPACFGLGARQLRRFDDYDVLCPNCAGFGRVEEEEGIWRWCRRCDGRGLIRAPEAPPPVYRSPSPRATAGIDRSEAGRISGQSE